MRSAWLINLKNGYKAILSEKIYDTKYRKETPKKCVRSEEHWFSMESCINENPDIDVFGDA